MEINSNVLIAIIAAVGAMVGSFAGVLMQKILELLEKRWKRNRSTREIQDLCDVLSKTKVFISSREISLDDVLTYLLPGFTFGAFRDDLDDKIASLLKIPGHRPKDSEKEEILGNLYSFGLIEKDFLKTEDISISSIPRFVLTDLGKKVYLEIRKKHSK